MGGGCTGVEGGGDGGIGGEVAGGSGNSVNRYESMPAKTAMAWAVESFVTKAVA